MKRKSTDVANDTTDVTASAPSLPDTTTTITVITTPPPPTTSPPSTLAQLQGYQKEFIQFSIQQKVLQFGTYTLKSGRISPYFFNAGLFHTGYALYKLGVAYATTIMKSSALTVSSSTEEYVYVYVDFVHKCFFWHFVMNERGRMMNFSFHLVRVIDPAPT